MEAFSKILAKVTNCGKQMYHTLNFQLPSRAYLILLGERMIHPWFFWSSEIQTVTEACWNFNQLKCFTNFLCKRLNKKIDTRLTQSYFQFNFQKSAWSCWKFFSKVFQVVKVRCDMIAPWFSSDSELRKIPR